MNKKITSFNNGLYLVATPIGNLADISGRAIKILKESEIILCENPFHSLKLLKNYGINNKLISLHDYNEERLIKKLSKSLSESLISLISDAGTPLISDPGYKLVKHCIKNDIAVTSVPGPCSVISALQLSGTPLNQFTFNGFIPKKIKQAEDLFIKCVHNTSTQVFFSSSNRILSNIAILQKYFKKREIAVCRELTKVNEQVVRGSTENIIKKLTSKANKLKGEFVIVVEGNNQTYEEKLDDKTISAIIGISKKFSLTDTVKIVHKLTKLSKKSLYEKTLQITKKKNEKY